MTNHSPVNNIKALLIKFHGLILKFFLLFKPLIIFLYIIFIFIALYHIIYAHRIIPGIRVGSVDVGSMTFDQAVAALKKYESATDKTVNLTYNSKNYSIAPEDIAFAYNWEASVSRAFENGRLGNFLIDTKDKIAGLFKPIFIPAFYDYDEEMFGNRLASLRGEVNVEGHDSFFELQKDKIKIVPAVSGLKIDDDRLFNLIINRYDHVKFDLVQIPTDMYSPKVIEADLDLLVPHAQKIILNKLTVKKDKLKWILDKAQILSMLKPQRDSDDKVVLTLNKTNYEAFVESLSTEVEVLPRGKVTADDNGKVTSFEIIKTGREIDKKVFTQNFKDALFNTAPSVELTMKDTSGLPDKSKYGIIALLGEGTSKYAGSIPGRMYNLDLAAQRTDGVLIPPNSTYSFNKTIGEVSGKTGYNSAYIISGGKTILGEGGGVCQTSTTLFRAVLNSGLPVVTRYPHAYRVHYYEEDSPVGFDAAVFQPSLDFQFKNETPNYVLIQMANDKPNVTLSFKLYGTPDGRTVEISKPVISRQIAPPAALYQDDPSLSKGLTRQIDWSAWGASVSFARVVKKGEQVLYNDTYKSVYQPWRAIFLVGTKE